MQSLHRVEKSPPSYGTGGITAGDLSTQSIIGAFSICPIPTCISARDDDVGERPSRHFDRSEVEWRNLPPLMVRAVLRGRSLDSEYHRIDSRLSPIPARTSARDDDVGERPSRHFDRSEAEWRNLTPQMTEKLSRALRHFDESRSAANRKASYCAG